MRDSIENISQLQKKLNDLQLENQILKNILDKAGLSYHKELSKLRQSGSKEAFDPKQGKRIIHPQAITENMANQFFSMFWGRQDVYAKRSVNKETGKAAYYPQCNNFWTNVCHKKIKDGINCKNCKNRSYKTITKKDILNHLQGNAYNASDVIGVYPLLSNGTCRFMVFDFDNHDKDAEEKDFANSDDTWVEEVESMREICVLNGIEPLVERSRSGRGAHVWIFFDKPIAASFVRKFGFALLDKGAEQINLKSFKYYDRMLPAQDSLPEDSAVGNLIALPLQGKALQDGNSAFIDGNWNAYPNQWETLFNKPRLSQEFLEEKIKEWSNTIDDIAANAAESDREKPWNRMQHFNKNDVEGKLHIILANGIYVDNTNLNAAMQNRIRRMAAFSNPVFYKNQAIGTSNYDTARWIYLGKDHLSGYIQIPRGLQDELWENIKQADIDYEMEDERQQGRKINVDFKGELRPEQDKALKELIRYDNGILHAATAFGKTVVSSAIIAQKKINTLIILESSALIEQWKEALEKFLNINEGLPTYETKTGRVRKRKSLIGTLQGAHDSMTGIIDIAMAGSLCKKGKYHKMMNEYGLVLIDECHHSASETIANVLKEVKAKYVYGVTATPKRGDGLEKINYMLIGPIRYSYTAKEKAKEQGIQHLVYPRFTRTVPPRGVITDKMHPNEAYEIIHNNDVRDEQIIEDVKNCVAAGRTPVVLSRYKDHSEKFYERLKGYADHVFLMTGNNSKKEHRKILEQMHQVDKNESLILIATGSLVGEGFDFPRLDTLFMATPVSFRGVVEQYAGRLNRDYAGKENVIIYDYVDNHIPMFNNMYMKRLKAYKQIGYEFGDGLQTVKQTVNAIYDGNNYSENYHKDLFDSNKNIIISSPVISGSKVYELINMLKEKQMSGVQVTIVTWTPDSYGFGDAAYWMQLHEDMRRAGFYIRTVEEYCDRFAVIDQEVVWYGNINLLAKDKVDDSIMRVRSKGIAGELMEITFRNNDGKAPEDYEN
ncbi:DEAD/DEAH box helicase family protein [Clostridium sp. AM34-9AC]|jgi:superfamily II DNA or RNA helicase|uniref:TOTE conflict system archaeo-eukaryotic primase domain-containing protein n=1 Tax=Clostridium sp. AM34-9AC TaxID=2293030 RepID=UPI000E5083AE|nr:DEAD/DEAH box helicase family protein [Clostridium sp. AM34-9AC]RHT18524.1 restriction endonuclease subunit R [Clostridium sp. AM34-9AC]